MAWVKINENRILNLRRITDIRVDQLYSSNGKLEWFIIFLDNNENQCTSHPYISKKECEKDFNYLIETLTRNIPYIDIINILQDPTDRVHMTKEYLIDKGFSAYKDTVRNFTANYVSSGKLISVQYGASNRPSCNWHVHIDNNSFASDSIGSLDFEYVDEFESFLKLCEIEL